MSIDDLREALEASPDNLPLRILLAAALRKEGDLAAAEQEYLKALNQEDNLKSRIALSEMWIDAKSTSAVVVFLEEAVQKFPANARLRILMAKAYCLEENYNQAQTSYEFALELDENAHDDDLDQLFRVGVNDEDDLIDQRFMEKPDTRFSDVGGMQNVKKEIALKIIEPLKHPELYEAYGKKAGGGILMYGPPGCGKTFIARATAGEIDAQFININITDILDMWIGNSEKNLSEFFNLARKHTPCVIFIDEVDALAASRRQMKAASGSSLINQFLAELDGINNSNEGILVLGATNMPWNLDPAFRRPGRFDRILFVPPPDELARQEILRSQLKGKPTDTIDYAKIAAKTSEFSGADLKSIIDRSIEGKLEESFKTGKIEPLKTKDLLKGLKGLKPSTKEWFEQAKNFALFSNNSGTYDPIVEYLKLRK